MRSVAVVFSRLPFGLSLRSVCLWMLFVGLSPVADADEAEIHIGVTSLGQIHAHVEFTQPFPLEVSVFPGISGYATGEMGLHSISFDEPAEDLYLISSAADLRLVLLANDPGMEIWNDHGSAFMQTNESYYVGVAPFDTHPVWNLLEGTPGNSYSLTIQLHDVSGTYSDSDPIPLSFTPAPPVLTIAPTAPGSVALTWAPATQGFVLQIANELGAWTNSPSGGTNPVTVAVSSGTAFFRLGR